MPNRAAATSTPGTGRKGRCESSVDRAVLAAYAAGVLDKDLDAAAIALARTLARATDEQARPDGNAWAVATLARELRTLLERLRLDPTARGSGDRDEFADFLSDLATPTPAALRDAT
jgi:hypothetical protein